MYRRQTGGCGPADVEGLTVGSYTRLVDFFEVEPFPLAGEHREMGADGCARKCRRVWRNGEPG
jgi:hypothetical protein